MSKITEDLTLSPHAFTLLTNHAHVLVLIAQKPDVRMREIANVVGITERAVQRIVDDLTSTGFIVVTKDGRRNRYEIQPGLPLRHPLDKHRTVGDLIRLLVPGYVYGNSVSDPASDERHYADHEDLPNGQIPVTVLSSQENGGLPQALNGTPAVMTHSAELCASEK